MTLLQWGFRGLVCAFLLAGTLACSDKDSIIFSGSEDNDLYPVLVKEGFEISMAGSPAQAINEAAEGTAVFIMAEKYPEVTNAISADLLETARKKNLKLYIEYPASFPGIDIPRQPLSTQLERGVVTSSVFGETLKPLSILGINDCYVLPVKVDSPLMVLAKVAGFDKAEYGIDDVEKYPLLFERDELY